MKIYKEVSGEQVCLTVPIIKEPQDAPSLWQRKIRTFLDAVKDGTGAPVPLSQIIINQAIISGIVRSSELGREIELGDAVY